MCSGPDWKTNEETLIQFDSRLEPEQIHFFCQKYVFQREYMNNPPSYPTVLYDLLYCHFDFECAHLGLHTFFPHIMPTIQFILKTQFCYKIIGISADS